MLSTARGNSHSTNKSASRAAEESSRIDWFATLGHRENRVSRTINSLVFKKSLPQRSHLNLILIDSSASTLQQQRLQETLGVVKGILHESYQNRQRVAVMQFGNQRIETLFAPAKAPSCSENILSQIHGGGGTPLRQGVIQALQLLHTQSKAHPGEHQHLYLLTDGRCRDALHDIQPKVPITLIDTEVGKIRLNRCLQLAEQLGATYTALDQLNYWSE